MRAVRAALSQPGTSPPWQPCEAQDEPCRTLMTYLPKSMEWTGFPTIAFWLCRAAEGRYRELAALLWTENRRALPLLALGIAAAILRFRGKRPVADAWLDIGLAAAVSAFSWYWLVPINPHPSLAEASVPQAFDCVERGRCALHCSVSTFALTNGGVWLDYLLGPLFLGGAIRATYVVMLALGAASMGLVALSAGSLFGRSAMVPSAAIALGLLSTNAYLSLPEAADQFPSTLAILFLVRLVRTESLTDAAMAGIFVAHAVNGHVAGASLVPPLFVLAALCSPAPFRSVAVAAAAFLGSSWITSSDALLDDLRASHETHWIPAAVFLVGLLAVASVRLRASFSKLSPRARDTVAAAVLVGPFLAGMAFLSYSHHEDFTPFPMHRFGVEGRYVMPMFAALGILGGAVLAKAASAVRIRGAWLVPVLASCVWVLWTTAEKSRDAREWDADDAERLATPLAQKGWNYLSMRKRIQGPGCQDIGAGLAAFSTSGPERTDRLQMRLWKNPDGKPLTLPANAESIPLRKGAAILAPIDSWLDAAGTAVCSERGPPMGGYACDMAAAEDAYRSSRLRVADALGPNPRRIYYSALLLPKAGETRTFDVSNPTAPNPDCAEIVAVEGVEVDRLLPAPKVRLTSHDGQPGRIFVVSSLDSPDCSKDALVAPPCFTESADGDPPWVANGQGAP
ncbi:MAG TPA: hypothetical protein VMT89_02355 [Candidatus Acidoferrales bacterium]|nr:hypothetical protein [Candidatus Acidoferrales bacterium]